MFQTTNQLGTLKNRWSMAGLPEQEMHTVSHSDIVDTKLLLCFGTKQLIKIFWLGSIFPSPPSQLWHNNKESEQCNTREYHYISFIALLRTHHQVSQNYKYHQQTEEVCHSPSHSATETSIPKHGELLDHAGSSHPVFQFLHRCHPTWLSNPEEDAGFHGWENYGTEGLSIEFN